MKKVQKICITCGKSFSVANYRKDTALYCSRKCQNTSTFRVEKILKTKEIKDSQCKTNIEIKYIEKILNKDGYTLLTKKYINQKTPLLVKCNKGHQYITNWYYIRKGIRCKFCAGHGRTIKDIKEMFNQIRYTLLNEEYFGSLEKLDYICDKGHRNTMTWSNFNNGTRCPDCSGCKKKSIEEIKEFLRPLGYTLKFDTYINKYSVLTIICDKNHTFETTWSKFKKSTNCPICSKQYSLLEKDLTNELKKYSNEIETNTRKMISPYELDIYFPKEKLAIEFCGLYWHSDKYKEKNYHRTKLDMCKEKGIRLITVFEDEWLEKREICIFRIKQALGLNKTKVFARNCEIKQISSKDANKFYEENHLQGKTRQKVAFGLFFDDKLLQVMSLGLPSRKHVVKDGKMLELKRLASVKNINVVGGASRLFKKCLEYAYDTNYNIIRSYCDLRWGTGSIYEKLGFQKVGESKYTPHYVKNQRRIRNQSLRKTQEEKLTGKTESQLRKEQGYLIIFDCGHQTWDYLLNN